ncbi:MAG: hypothetical protein ACJ8AK_15710 [Gemmatimonadaceae bacterium]
MRRTSITSAVLLLLLTAACARDVAGPRSTDGQFTEVAVLRAAADVTTQSTPAADPAIAYGSQSGKPNHVVYGLYVMNSDGSNQTALLTTASSTPHPSWSPDGHSIAYHAATYDITRADVSVVNGVPRAGTPVALPITHTAFDIAWSPDPTNPQIAYTESQGNIGAPAGIYVISTTPSGFSERLAYLGPQGNRMIWVTWNPQATKLAFVQRSIDVAVDSVFVLDVATSTTTFVRSFVRGVLGLSWSRTPPDRLALAIPQPNNASGYDPSILDLSTNTITHVASGPSAKWSPDDSYLVYLAPQRNASSPVYKVNLSTGVQTLLAAQGTEPEWRRNP